MSFWRKLGKTVTSMATGGLSNLFDAAGGVQGITDTLAGTDSSKVSFTPAPRDASAQAIWNQYMQYLNGTDESGNAAPGSLLGLFSGQSDWLNNQFNQYNSALSGSSSEYGNILDSLTKRMTNPNSQVSFGMQGMSPVSFTPRQTREDIGTLQGLAEKAMENKMLSPTARWSWAQENPLNSADLKYFNAIGDLANNMEDRRYQTATKKVDDTSKAGVLDLLTAGGNLLQSGSGLLALLGL